MSEEKIPNLGEPGAPTREDVEEFARISMGFILKEIIGRGQMPILLLAADIDLNGQGVSVWPVIPGANRQHLAKIMRDAAAHMEDPTNLTETVDGTPVIRDFDAHLQKGAGRADQ